MNVVYPQAHETTALIMTTGGCGKEKSCNNNKKSTKTIGRIVGYVSDLPTTLHSSLLEIFVWKQKQLLVACWMMLIHE